MHVYKLVREIQRRGKTNLLLLITTKDKVQEWRQLVAVVGTWGLVFRSAAQKLLCQ